MNRRHLLAILGASPVAAALPAVAEAKPFEVPDNRAKVEPILGELRYVAEQTPTYYFHNGYGPVYYSDPCHTYTLSFASGGTVAVLKIYDGEKWVNEDSQEGVAVKNRVLRS